MSLTASDLALSLLSRTTIKPQLILEIEGVGSFSTSKIKKYISYDDPETYYDDGLNYDSLIEDKSILPYIDLSKSTNSITQQLLLDKGGFSSTSTFEIVLVDVNEYVTNLITPGNVVDDMLARKARIYLAVEGGGHPKDSILFFSGVISDIKAGAGYVSLNVSSPEKLKSSDIFQTANTILTDDINNVNTTITIESTSDFISPSDGTTLETYIQINDEIIKVGSIASSTTFTGCTRAQFGTIAASHSTNDEVSSFYRLQGNLRDLALKLMLSGASEYYSSGIEIAGFVSYGDITSSSAVFLYDLDPELKYGIVAGDSVNIISAVNSGNNGTANVLSINKTDLGSYLILDKTLVTEVAGATISFKSKYNVLPIGAGIGMTPDQVDIAQYERIYDQFSGQFFEYDFYIKETVNGSEFINSQILYPSGAYALPRKARTSLGLTIPPLAQSGTKRLTNANVINASNIKIVRSLSKNFYNAVVYRYEKDAVTDKYLRGNITQSADSINRINWPNKPLNIDADGVRSSGLFQEVIDTQTRRFLDRYKYGAESLEVQVNFSTGFTIEIGDTVILDGQQLHISDTKNNNGTRKFLPRLFEVQNKSFSMKGTPVTLNLVDTVYSLNGRYGVISPSSIIDVGSTVTKLNLKSSYSDDLTGRFSTVKWSNYLGEKVMIRNEDWTYIEETTILSIDPGNPNALIIEAIGTAPTENLILDIPNYPNSTDSSDKAIYKASHCFWTMSRNVLTGSTSTRLYFSSSDAAAFVEGAPVIVRSEDWTTKSVETKIESVFLSNVLPSYVDLKDDLGFTPTVDMKIDLLGFPDSGAPYRWL